MVCDLLGYVKNRKIICVLSGFVKFCRLDILDDVVKVVGDVKFVRL